MNLSIYVFKKYSASVGNKVLSFPTDLEKLIEEVVDSVGFNHSQRVKLIVLRHDNLVHYLYVVKIEADLVGFVFTMNGAYLADVGPLCRACSDVIAAISSQGLIITWSGRNGLVFTTKNVAVYREEAEKVMVRLVELRDNSVFSKAGSLPPLDYSEAKQSKVLDWSGKTIIDTIPDEYRHIDRLEILLPPVNYSVSAVLAEANKEAEMWKKHYSDLSTRFNTLNRQKKRMKWVVMLALCLVAGGVILFKVNKNLSHTQSDLSDANSRIGNLTADIDSLTVLNTSYLNDIGSLKDIYLNAVGEISAYESRTPIKINDIWVYYKYNGNSYEGIPYSNHAPWLYLEVSYTANRYKVADIDSFPSRTATQEECENDVAAQVPTGGNTGKELTIRLRCYYRRYSSDEYVYKATRGTNPFTVTVTSSGSFNTSNFDMGFSTMPAGDYRIELWDDAYDTCMAFKQFRID